MYPVSPMLDDLMSAPSYRMFPTCKEDGGSVTATRNRLHSYLQNDFIKQLDEEMDRIGEPHSTHDLMLALSMLPVPVLPLLLLGLLDLGGALQGRAASLTHKPLASCLGLLCLWPFVARCPPLMLSPFPPCCLGDPIAALLLQFSYGRSHHCTLTAVLLCEGGFLLLLHSSLAAVDRYYKFEEKTASDPTPGAGGLLLS